MEQLASLTPVRAVEVLLCIVALHLMVCRRELQGSLHAQAGMACGEGYCRKIFSGILETAQFVMLTPGSRSQTLPMTFTRPGVPRLMPCRRSLICSVGQVSRTQNKHSADASSQSEGGCFWGMPRSSLGSQGLRGGARGALESGQGGFLFFFLRTPDFWRHLNCLPTAGYRKALSMDEAMAQMPEIERKCRSCLEVQI